jgi:nucleotide-binding universal stress UspA family protein
MNLWIVLLAMGIVALVFVLVPVAVATFRAYRKPLQLPCPMAGTPASIQVDAAGAAFSELRGAQRLRVMACSRWPRAWGCRQQCVAGDGAHALGGASRTSRTILVALDGTPERETAVAEAAAIAQAEGARLRLLWTSRVPAEVLASNRVVAYADQEEERVALEAYAYLKCLADRLPGIAVDPMVRFGEPAEEIVAEAAAAGVDLIALATPEDVADPAWAGVADAVARATTIPIMRVSRR